MKNENKLIITLLMLIFFSVIALGTYLESWLDIAILLCVFFSLFTAGQIFQVLYLMKEKKHESGSDKP